MLRKYPQLKFGLVLVMGALIALMLCIQCVRTYLYTDAVLVPQQAEHEATRQGGALSAAARTAGITDPRRLGPEPLCDRIIEQVTAFASSEAPQDDARCWLSSSLNRELPFAAGIQRNSYRSSRLIASAKVNRT